MLLFDYEPVEWVDDNADVAVVVAAKAAAEAAEVADVTDTAASDWRLGCSAALLTDVDVAEAAAEIAAEVEGESKTSNL